MMNLDRSRSFGFGVQVNSFKLLAGVLLLLAVLPELIASTVAHWRFEEGPAASRVPSVANSVLDSSGNGNHLRTHSDGTAPTYLTDTPFNPVPRTRENNFLALNFFPNRDLYTVNKPIDWREFDEWTIELAFKPHGVDPNYPIRVQTIFGKDGDPLAASSRGTRPSPIAIRILSNGRLEVGLVDGSRSRRSVTAIEPLRNGEWYHVAATADSNRLSLWLKGPGQSEHVLVGDAGINGAFFNEYSGLNRPWTVGRGMEAGSPAHWFDGVIDEIRISDRVLEPEDFLASSIDFDPAGLETAPAWVRVGRDRYLALETWESNGPEVFALESSSNLVDWEEIPYTTLAVQEAGQAEEGRERVAMVSEIRDGNHERYFLRKRLVESDPVLAEAGNPILAGADPDVLLVDDTFWIYPTYRSTEGLMFAFSSRDLVNWRMHGPILRFSDIDWMPGGKFAWAPGVAEKDGKFYLYYSAGPKPSHIGVAVADSPAGPFIDSGQPLLSDNNNPAFEAIDAMVFTDPESGQTYFYAGGSAGATLLVYRLAPDMVNLSRPINVDTPPNFTEGAFMHYRNGIYYLSYSNGYWRDQSYSVHYATSSSPTGPWTYRGVILESDENHKGPGHHSIIYHPGTNQWLIIYHRWNHRTGSGPYSGLRKVAIDRLVHNRQGLIQPVIMTDSGVGLLEP